MEKKSLKEWEEIFEEGEKENLLFLAKDLNSIYVRISNLRTGWQEEDILSFQIKELMWKAKQKLLKKYGIYLDKEKAMEALETIRRAVENRDMTLVSSIKDFMEEIEEYISPKFPSLFPSSSITDKEIMLYAEKIFEAEKRTLGDLDTSDEELDELKIKSAKIKAKYWLECARKEESDKILDYIQWVREYFEKGLNSKFVRLKT